MKHQISALVIAGFFASAASLGVAIATPAHAAAIINLDNSVTFDNTGGPNAVEVAFTGIGGDPKLLVPGLTATLTLTLTSIAGSTFNFGYSMQNTSTVAGTRVSGFGFNVDPNVSNVAGASSTGVFDQADFDGANFASFGAEICFNGGPGNCPESNPANSVAFGATGSGTLALTFSSPQTSITLSNFLDRYQGFSTTNVGGEGVTSAIGRGTPSIPNRPFEVVPEPTTWALMLVGFGAIGAAMRRRQRANVAATLSLN